MPLSKVKKTIAGIRRHIALRMTGPQPLPTDSESVAALNAKLEAMDATARLRWAYETFGDKAAFGTSFQGAGIVAMDLAHKAGLPIPVFTLDTGLLFVETIELKSALQDRFGIRIESLRPYQSVEEQAKDFGPELWKTDPDLCCTLRKVNPLRDKLATLHCWITGVRREQSTTRADSGIIELVGDESGDGRLLWKFNPLADWSRDAIWAHIKANHLPYNPLQDRGYRSIGCTVCTRATAEGQDERAGRWTGFGKTECGIHTFLKKKA
jgi:phosphoadenosine phosphosulfate reductase